MTLQERHKQELERALKNQLGATDEILSEWENESYPADGQVVSQFWGYIKAAPEIKVVGDYDVDGICASYALSKSIKAVCPGKKVGVRIPRRFSEGYGINDVIADEIIQNVAPGGLIITVDNGIAAGPVLERIRDAGFKVIVTDHHELREEADIPDVDMVIDPAVNSIYNPFTGRYWCGAAVAYKLCEPMIPEKLRNELEVYTGLATVADCMILKEGNWGIVRRAIKAFREKKAPEALVNLLVGMKQDPNFCNEDHFGFYLGPAFNAPGRLMDRGAVEVLKYLSNPTPEQCEFIITKNNERKNLRDTEYAVVRDAVISSGQEQACPIWVAVPGLHEGIVGILAGKLTEEFGRPAIVMTAVENNPGMYKGSARSVDGFNIFKYLTDLGNELAVDVPDGKLFARMGGHAGAAGLSMSEDNIEIAKSKQQYIQDMATVAQKGGISMSIRQWEIPGIHEVLDIARPFGEGNPAPEFSVEVDLHRDKASFIGAEHNHLMIRDGQGRYKLTHFNHIPNELSDAEHFGMKGKISGSAFAGVETPTFNAEEVFDIIEDREREFSEENL